MQPSLLTLFFILAYTTWALQEPSETRTPEHDTMSTFSGIVHHLTFHLWLVLEA
jgi:hypothetical protein